MDIDYKAFVLVFRVFCSLSFSCFLQVAKMIALGDFLGTNGLVIGLVIECARIGSPAPESSRWRILR